MRMANHRERGGIRSFPVFQETLNASGTTFKLNALNFDHGLSSKSVLSLHALRRISTQLGAAGTRHFKSHLGSRLILRDRANKTGSSGKNNSGVFSKTGVKSSIEK